MDCVPTMRYCYNCGKLLYGFRMEDRSARFTCTCGVQLVSRIKTRRKEEVVVFLPEGDYIADYKIGVSSF